MYQNKNKVKQNKTLAAFPLEGAPSNIFGASKVAQTVVVSP
jgi:hypothetical protein